MSSQALMAGLVVFVYANASAVVPNNDSRTFAGIPNRNIFGLKAAQQPVVSNPPPVLPKLILQGITTILGNKRALLKEEPLVLPGAKSPANGEDLSMILTEGQRQGHVEVLLIDEKAGSVKVNNSGTVMTLTFEKDGARLPSTPASTNPAVQPGYAPGRTPGGLPPGPGSGIPPATNSNGKTPHRTPRWPMNETAQTSSTPTRAGYPTTAVPGPAANNPPTDLTAQEQAIISEFQNHNQPANPMPAANAGSHFVTPQQEGIAPGFVPPSAPLPQ